MRTYLSILLGVAALTVLGVVAVSLSLDPYRIVHDLPGAYVFEPNTRVSKVSYLAQKCSAYDAYIVGDSRSAILNGDDMGEIAGRRFFNLAAQADDIVSIVRRLNFLIAKRCPISAVVIGESVDVVIGEAPDSLLKTENPSVSGENRLAFYAKYFLSVQALMTYAEILRGHPAPRYVYHPDGHVDYMWGMSDSGEFQRARCGSGKLGDQERQSLLVKLEGYREIARMSARYNFRTIIWIAPLNKWQSSLLDDPFIKDYLNALRAIPNLAVIDAERGSPLLADFHAWHDCEHFRRIVFDQLVAPAAAELLAGSGSKM